MSSTFENTCIQCGSITGNPKFCTRSCSVAFNNKVKPKKKRTSERLDQCLNCGNKVKRSGRVYCSSVCSSDHRSYSIYKNWLSGEEEGLSSIGTLKKGIKDWLRKERGDSCERCGWSVKNEFTGIVPIEASHIDGNYKNNRPDNIELLCPNCHSLTESYRGRNMGHGRPWRSNTTEE